MDRPNAVDTGKTFSVKYKQPDLIIKNTSPPVSENETLHSTSR